MKILKCISLTIVNLIFLTLCGMIIRAFLVDGIANYVKHIKYFGLGYSDILDCLFFLIILFFFFLLHRLFFLGAYKKNVNVYVQAITIALSGTLLIYIFTVLTGGFVLSFNVNLESLKKLVPIFIVGFMLPISQRIVYRLVN